MKFETREEAAKFMIDNPGVVLVDGVGDKVRWNCGGFEVLSSLNKWEYVCYLDPTPFTLPEPEKEELPELRRLAMNIAHLAKHEGGTPESYSHDVDLFVESMTRFAEDILAEAESRARRIADERIEAASVVNGEFALLTSYKLKRGAK